MPALKWDQVGDRTYETGVSHGALYLPNESGIYDSGFAWNGLVTITEAPTGAASNPHYADNLMYLNLIAAEHFAGTIAAYTYPEEFEQCDGTAAPSVGLAVGQQTRKPFGLSYRTLLGNDLAGTDYGYKIHLVYGALAAPSQKAYGTVNDTPAAIEFSWGITTTPVEVPGFKPSAKISIDSSKVSAAHLASLEDILYGKDAVTGTTPSPAVAARLPLPGEIITLFGTGA